jgi:signal transduction histidine kinase
LLAGVAFGLLFPIIAIIADCFFFNDLEVTCTAIGKQIKNNPIHFIILSAPLFLGGTFYYIGRFAANQRKSNRELIQANMVMKETNELLDTFNYHVSHDLKSVLNNQIVLSRMMSKYVDKYDPQKLTEIAEKLIDVSEKGLATVMQFLVMSKEGYLINTETSTIDVQAEMTKILIENGCEELIGVKFTRVDYSTLEIQAKVFETIFVNLLTNAIKYNKNSPAIEIQLIARAKGKQILFKDNGIGIDLEKNADKIFAPFQRISDDSNVEGTGVGLFIVKKLIQAHFGTIAVRSELGHGTEFDIFIPNSQS